MQVRPNKSRVASRYLQAHPQHVIHVSMISKNLIRSFEPYVKDHDDADLVAENVFGTFCQALNAKFAKVLQELKVVQFSTMTNTQSFGFDDGGRDGEDKASLWGHVSYPVHCHMAAAWKINTEKRWQEALKAHARDFKPNANYLSIPVPQAEITKHLTDERGNWGLPSNNYPIFGDLQETIEQAMYRSSEFEEDHDTEYTDHNGEEIDSDVGETPRYDFGFRASKFPEITVQYGSQALVRLEYTVDIHLKDVISPWDRHHPANR